MGEFIFYIMLFTYYSVLWLVWFGGRMVIPPVKSAA